MGMDVDGLRMALDYTQKANSDLAKEVAFLKERVLLLESIVGVK